MPPMTNPPPQHSAEMKPALSGPACSNQPPQIAAEMPSMAMKVSKICVTAGTVQLHDPANSCAKKPMLPQLAAPGSSLLIGNQNTEKPYAIPIHRWMAKAAGGTNHRLK